MSTIKRVAAAMERIAPLSLADRSWDNVGILVEAPVLSSTAPIVMLTNDLTDAVVEEARQMKVSTIVAYHPPIFKGWRSLTQQDSKQRQIINCIASGISVFSPHTSLDAVPNGINDWLLDAFKNVLDKRSIKAIIPSQATGKEPPSLDMTMAGMGRMGKFTRSLSLQEVVTAVQKHLDLRHVRVARAYGRTDTDLKSVAVCAGSGASVCSKARHADVWVTGEMSHHEVLATVANGTHVILCEHTNTERGFFSQVFRDRLQQELNQDTQQQMLQVVVSKTDRDPIETVTLSE